MDFNIGDITLLITAATQTLISFFVLYSATKAKEKIAYYSFSGVTFSLGMWVTTNLFIDIVDTQSAAIWWTRLSGLAMINFVIFLLYFSTNYAASEKNLKSINFVHLALHVFIAITFFTTPFVVESIEMDVFPREVVYNSLGYTFTIIYILLNLLVSIYNFIKNFLRASRENKVQMSYLIIGLVTFITLTLITNLLLPIFGNKELTRFGPAATLSLTVFTLISMIRERLFGIRFIIGRSIRFLILLFLTAFFDLILIKTYTSIFGTTSSSPGVIYLIIVSLLFILIFQFFNKRLTSNSLLKSVFEYDPVTARDTIIKQVSEEIDFDKLINKLFYNLSSIFNTENIAFLIFNKNKQIEQKKTFGHNWEETEFLNNQTLFLEIVDLIEYDENFIHVDALKNYISKHKQLKLESLESLEFVKKGLATMNKLKIDIIAPIYYHKNKLGVLLIGAKAENRSYNKEDLSFLRSILGAISVSIKNSLAHEKVRKNYDVIQNFNRTLQKKVDEATAKLKERNKELQGLYDNLEELYQKEKDLMDIAGHELRTPASILKNNLFLLKNRLEKVCPQNMEDEKLQKYISRLKESTERQIRLVNTFLESARMENDKFSLDFERAEFGELVNRAVEETKPFADRKGLELIFEPIKKKIHADIDPTRLREVLDNLLNNAVKYTKSGYIKVDVEENKEDETIKFSVKDSGIGISKKDQKFLFKKFSRVQTHIGGKEDNLVRPGGTGLGLYVAKNIIEEHNGEIGVESEKGKGSTFYFVIPKNQPNAQVSQSPLDKFKNLANK